MRPDLEEQIGSQIAQVTLIACALPYYLRTDIHLECLMKERYFFTQVLDNSETILKYSEKWYTGYLHTLTAVGAGYWPYPMIIGAPTWLVRQMFNTWHLIWVFNPEFLRKDVKNFSRNYPENFLPRFIAGVSIQHCTSYSKPFVLGLVVFFPKPRDWNGQVLFWSHYRAFKQSEKQISELPRWKLVSETHCDTSVSPLISIPRSWTHMYLLDI